MTSLGMITGYIKVKAHGDKPFYASDLHLSGGTIGGLQSHGIIKKTGNTKTIEFPHPYEDGLFFRKEVYEWIFVDKHYSYFNSQVEKAIPFMREALIVYDSMK